MQLQITTEYAFINYVLNVDTFEILMYTTLYYCLMYVRWSDIYTHDNIVAPLIL